MTAEARRRLGVYSLGFLWQPALREALAAAGWRVLPGLGRTDAIGVWGRRGVARRGLAAAKLTGAPVLTIEDGFLRSVAPGVKRPVISLILDDLGVYYDPSTPSRLERLIAEGAGDLYAARTGIARLRDARLSKYNHARDHPDPPEGHVLVIDQTRGDASVTWGGATAETFQRMLDAARAEHPGRQIILKTHPEVASGAKQGHFSSAVPGVEIYADPVNPWDLIEGAHAVYTVSSQLGFEALIAGRPVRCFGQPFYAGWGATEDETPVARRTERRSAEQIFAAAYLDYPTYFDPWTGALSSFDAAVDALITLRAAHRRNQRPAVCSGVRLWKRRAVSGFLSKPSVSPRFVDDPAKAQRLAQQDGARWIAWASKVDHAEAARMEDGFLRSPGLGAALTPPSSLVIDDEGIYYDPTRPSTLERLIETADETPAKTARARALIDSITRLGVSKYNLTAKPVARPDHPRVILAPGQVEDDASIRLGAGDVRTNLGLLKAIRAAAPDAHVIYKPHPDVEAGLRPGKIERAEALKWADAIAEDADPIAAIDAVDEVWTMTSLIGFEALIRGKTVTCFGAPFYAGWGLTDDRGAPPDRRTNRPSLEALTHAALIDYPIYRDPVSGLPCEAELIVKRLAAGIGGAGPGGKVLSKAQGLFASYAWLWR